MKSLVVYYSRTGNTKKVALEIAKKLNSDIDEIQDLKKKNTLGVVLACRHAMKKKSSDIKYSKKPENYDLVILGGPVWAWNLMPQLRRYLEENKNKIKKLGFFLTYGGNYGKNMEQISEFKKPIATASFIDKDIKANRHKKELNNFIKTLK